MDFELSFEEVALGAARLVLFIIFCCVSVCIWMCIKRCKSQKQTTLTTHIEHWNRHSGHSSRNDDVNSPYRIRDIPLIEAESEEFNSISADDRRDTEFRRPIGFTEAVVEPSAPYPVENLMPEPAESVRPTAPPGEILDTSPAQDDNPPSYEEVMRSETVCDQSAGATEESNCVE
ncbi:uncharacterized protein LOC132258606 [Phlebotomus argentipes]|uniref:uncharacterized protein LOC132258606 n=1 Tax=Phlebotomus argentipes TaxID=94469 RepID=UPI002892CEDE|nr:uncharacterized protein LOC132258606 [Phlebotomus argentipes]